MDPQPTRPARHDLRRVRVVEHHDRRAGQFATGVGQEIRWGLGHFFVGPRGPGRRAFWSCERFWPGAASRGRWRVILARRCAVFRCACRPALWDAVGRFARAVGRRTGALRNWIGVPLWCRACICAWPSTRLLAWLEQSGVSQLGLGGSFEILACDLSLKAASSIPSSTLPPCSSVTASEIHYLVIKQRRKAASLPSQRLLDPLVASKQQKHRGRTKLCHARSIGRVPRREDAFVAPLRRVNTACRAAVEAKAKTPRWGESRPAGRRGPQLRHDDCPAPSRRSSCSRQHCPRTGRPLGSREARPSSRGAPRQNKKLAKKDGRVVEVAGELSAFDKAEAAGCRVGAVRRRAAAGAGRDLKRIYGLGTEDILKDRATPGASSAGRARPQGVGPSGWASTTSAAVPRPCCGAAATGGESPAASPQPN